MFLKIAADGRSDPAAFFENFAAVVVHDEVDVTLAVSGLNVGQAVELFRQRLQGFADNVKLFGSNRKLSAGGAADKAGNADQIADVQAFQKFQPGLVKMAFVAENLDLSALVFQIDEHAAVAHRHRAAGNRHPVFGIFSGRQIFVFFLQIGGKSIRFETIRIGIVAFFRQGIEFCQAGFSVDVGFCCHW